MTCARAWVSAAITGRAGREGEVSKRRGAGRARVVVDDHAIALAASSRPGLNEVGGGAEIVTHLE